MNDFKICQSGEYRLCVSVCKTKQLKFFIRKFYVIFIPRLWLSEEYFSADRIIVRTKTN